MSDSDEILNATVVYTEQEVLAEFQASCEAEAAEPAQHRKLSDLKSGEKQTLDDVIRIKEQYERILQRF